MNLFDLFAQEYRTKPINQKDPLVALNELIAPVDGYTWPFMMTKAPNLHRYSLRRW
ncbi:MAG: hypothetical protein JHC38_00005 [Thiotrichales bacterium]|nr:hypothetical protein [Thiotrichales bacterium]